VRAFPLFSLRVAPAGFLFSSRHGGARNVEKIRRVIGRIIVPGRLFRRGIYFVRLAAARRRSYHIFFPLPRPLPPRVSIPE